MARIAGVDIPRDKRVVISLTYIYGIGKPTAQQILAAAGVSEDTRVRDLTEDELNRIRAEVDKEINAAIDFGKKSPRPDKDDFLNRIKERYAL